MGSLVTGFPGIALEEGIRPGGRSGGLKNESLKRASVGRKRGAFRNDSDSRLNQAAKKNILEIEATLAIGSSCHGEWILR